MFLIIIIIIELVEIFRESLKHVCALKLNGGKQ
jgi:hypothetical protein